MSKSLLAGGTPEFDFHLKRKEAASIEGGLLKFMLKCQRLENLVQGLSQLTARFPCGSIPRMGSPTILPCLSRMTIEGN